MNKEEVGKMKRILALLLICSLILCSCTSTDSNSDKEIAEKNDEYIDVSKLEQEISYEELSDPNLLTYVENAVYTELITDLDSEEFFVENVEAIYYSKEYLEELEYNSKSNIYFGYTLAEIDEIFEGERYVFTLGEDGKTTIKAFEKYDNTYEQVIKNVVTGAGVILICVTVSAVTAGGAPAVSMIFAASAKTGTIMGLSSGALGGVASGIVTGIETGDLEQAIKAAALDGSEAFKWGVITGAISGGASETTKYYKAMKALKGVELNGLTKQQAALIQMESKFPVDVVKQFKNMDQYKICKNAKLTNKVVNGRNALLRDIDINYVDDVTGKTNLELMKLGNAPVDPATGTKYQLHHIGQKADSTLAILTEAEHKMNGNHKIWHDLSITSEVHTSVNNWDTQRKNFWKAIGKMYEGR